MLTPAAACTPDITACAQPSAPSSLSQPQVVSSTLAGAALGSLGGGGLADAFGRRACFLLAALPMAVGPLLSASAGGLNAMVAGRFVVGLAIGLSSALVPTYISEVRLSCLSPRKGHTRYDMTQRL